MEELVKFIAQNLVEKPDEVTVLSKETERGPTVELHVAQDDMGKVIGKQGKIAKAIRKVVKAAATKKDETCVVEIV